MNAADAKQLARLTEKARRLFDSHDEPHVAVKPYCVGVFGTYDVPLLTLPNRPNALAALEAALDAYNGDVPADAVVANDFQPYPKIPRLNRAVMVTEKIDGTNAQIDIGEDGTLRAGSRSRWITPANDNFGFARWVEGNRNELLKLGPGRHFGEWWGQGIQRGYGLTEKRFSLFNVKRWLGSEDLPACCSVVPFLFAGPFDSRLIADQIDELRTRGSRAAPGFMKPEGVIVWHVAAGQAFKVTCEKDEASKGEVADATRP